MIVLPLVSVCLLNIIVRSTNTCPISKVQRNLSQIPEQCLLRRFSPASGPGKTDAFLLWLYQESTSLCGPSLQNRGLVKRGGCLSGLEREALLLHLCNTPLIMYYQSKDRGCSFCLYLGFTFSIGSYFNALL